MRRFPRTNLHLSILRQELISLEGLSKLSTQGGMESGLLEMRRMEQIEESIAEIEFLLQLAEQRPEFFPRSLHWSASQFWLILAVMVSSGLLMLAGLWASLILR